MHFPGSMCAHQHDMWSVIVQVSATSNALEPRFPRQKANAADRNPTLASTHASNRTIHAAMQPLTTQVAPQLWIDLSAATHGQSASTGPDEHQASATASSSQEPRGGAAGWMPASARQTMPIPAPACHAAVSRPLTCTAGAMPAAVAAAAPMRHSLQASHAALPPASDASFRATSCIQAGVRAGETALQPVPYVATSQAAPDVALHPNDNATAAATVSLHAASRAYGGSGQGISSRPPCPGPSAARLSAGMEDRGTAVPAPSQPEHAGLTQQVREPSAPRVNFLLWGSSGVWSMFETWPMINSTTSDEPSSKQVGQQSL